MMGADYYQTKCEIAYELEMRKVSIGIGNNNIRNIPLNVNYGVALGANALAKELEGNKSIKELHLHGNSIGDEGIHSLITGLTSHKRKLTLLDICNNSLTDKDKGAFYVVGYIKKIKSLLWLNICMNDIDERDAARLHIGDIGLLNYVLKSLDNVIVGNYVKVIVYCCKMTLN